MIIGIDIRVLGSQPKAGVVEYTEQIISRLVKIAPEHQFKFFFSSLKRSPPEFDWLSAPNAKLYHYRIPNNLLFVLARFFNRPRIDLLIGGADVFFSPHFLPVALSGNCQRVTTFHDLSFVRFPEFFNFGKRLWHWFVDPFKAARFSNQLIAVSESTKSDLVGKYHIDPSKIRVVYSGSSITRPTMEKLEQFQRTHNLPKRFIFSLSTLEPRKNILGIVRSFELLKHNQDFQDLKLVIAGSKGWLYDQILEEIKNSKFSEDIIYLDRVEDRECYYSLASVFLYPSFFEGFGLPVVEAMACQTPVVTSNNSSLVEVAGPAAMLVNPYNISEISLACQLILESPQARASLVGKGLDQIKQFNWDISAQKTLDLLVHR